MKKSTYRFLISGILFLLGWWGSNAFNDYLENHTNFPALESLKPLEKYTIENLSKTQITQAKVETDGNIFEFEFDPTLKAKNLKKVTGRINISTSGGPFPIVILLRGYVDQSIYKTGMGSERVGQFLSENGYITLAPDFLGYGGSSNESANIFETRFQTYTTVLTLLSSINRANFPSWDGKNIFIWAHSNGGQIALTTLSITKTDYPTVLWAPVTESFPYSVLYYTNESEDGGKYIRHELAKFENIYEANLFSFTNYLDRINAPIEYHLGTNDDAIPLEWRDRFLSKMKLQEKVVTNYNHPGADHNMNPLWDDVISETLEFFESHRKI